MALALPLAVVLPGGRRMGPRDAALTLRLNELFALAPLAQGQIGRCCCTRPGRTACAATDRAFLARFGNALHAAGQYGVRGHGIALSRDQPAHVNRPIDERGHRGPVTMDLFSLNQMLAARPSGTVANGPMRGAQSAFPFNRGYMYPVP